MPDLRSEPSHLRPSGLWQCLAQRLQPGNCLAVADMIACHFHRRRHVRAAKQVLALEAKLRKAWQDDLFLNQYIPAVMTEARRYAQHDEFVTWFSHLCDAFEIVDLPSGAIRDQPTSAWLLHEVLNAMSRIDEARVQQWVKTLRRHQAHWLTSMAWLTPALTSYQMQLAQVLEHPLAQTQFIQLVAQQWRLRQALVNGNHHWRLAADRTATMLQSVTAGSPTLAALAQQLARHPRCRLSHKQSGRVHQWLVEAIPAQSSLVCQRRCHAGLPQPVHALAQHACLPER